MNVWLSVFFCVGLALVSSIGCNCQHSPTGPGENGGDQLRIVSPEQLFSGTPAEIRIMIVGGGKPLRVEDIEVVESQAVDTQGKSFGVDFEKHPGESSKYGPYALLRFDPSGGRARIAVTAKLRYSKDYYIVSGTFLAGGPQDTYLWRGEGVELTKAE